MLLERQKQEDELRKQQLAAEEEARKARAAADDAAKAGDDVRVGELLIAAAAKESEAEAAQHVALARVAPGKLAGVSERKDWDFEITDPELLPRKYLIPDEQKIRKVAKALGAECKIPGVRVFQKGVISVRSRRN